MKRSRVLRIAATAGLAIGVAFPTINHVQTAGAARQSAMSGNVGFLFSDFTTSDRWKSDKAYYIAALQSVDPGIQVLTTDAKADQTRQQTQASSLLTKGVKVLVDVPTDSSQAGNIVTAAHANKPYVPVIAYDRLITGAKEDAYVSFDGFSVGVQQAKYLVAHLKAGATIVSIAGATTDNNAHLFHDGAMSVLKGHFKIVYDKYTPSWDPNTAQNEMNSALTQTKNKIDAVLCANDGMAQGVVAALQAQHLTGKVLVTGQDATTPGLQQILLGNQSMTIYKPLKKLAGAAAQITDDFLRGKKPDLPTMVTAPGMKFSVPSKLLPVITITKANISVVIKDGFVKKSDLCTKNIPASACKGL